MRRFLLLALSVSLLTTTLPGHSQSGITHNVETFLRVVDYPTALAFAPDGRLFYTEKETGRVRVVSPDGTLQPDPVIRLQTHSDGEMGLIGIAIDPDFSENGYIWVYHTAPLIVDGVYTVVQRVVRFREENGVGADPLVMLEVPYAGNLAQHIAGNLHFDADGYLYVSMGDNTNPAFSQDVSAYQGKILRFEVVGDELRIPANNPWPDSPAFAMGLRNPIDFALDPFSDEVVIFGTENGPSCDDEVNRITAGTNHGWRPEYGGVTPCDNVRPGEFPEYTYPVAYYTPTIAPVGIEVYSGEAMPAFTGNLFFCAWKDGKMRRLVLDETRTAVLLEEEVELRGTLCHTDIATGPDGALYYASTSGIHRLVGVEGD